MKTKVHLTEDLDTQLSLRSNSVKIQGCATQFNIQENQTCKSKLKETPPQQRTTTLQSNEQMVQ